MQTILGASGQIGEQLARELYQHHTRDIRLVSRSPKKLNESDQLCPADLMDADATDRAVAGSDIAYLTVGLPIDSSIWEERFPTMMRNVIAACKKHDCALVFFDNTYMYPKTATPQTESTPFEPRGRKAVVRAQLARLLLDEMTQNTINAVICRAPEFYGPGKTQSLTNSLIFDNLRRGRNARVPVSATTRRTLIWTPDASRAMALIANTPDAFGQTWHLPCDDSRLTYEELITTASLVTSQDFRYSVIPRWTFRVGGAVNKQAREVQELLPRYAVDNIFESAKFQHRFPEFAITTYREGIEELLSSP